MQETPIEGVELIARLMAVTSNNPEARIYVRGDQALAYGRVMEVMGEIAAAGFTKVSLIAEMPKGTASIQHKPAVAKAVAHPRQQANVPTLQQMVPQPTRVPQAASASRAPKMSPEQYPTGMLQHPPKR